MKDEKKIESKDVYGNFRFKQSVYTALHKLAEVEHRSMSNYLEILIFEALEKAKREGKVSYDVKIK